MRLGIIKEKIINIFGEIIFFIFNNTIKISANINIDILEVSFINIY